MPSIPNLPKMLLGNGNLALDMHASMQVVIVLLHVVPMALLSQQLVI